VPPAPATIAPSQPPEITTESNIVTSMSPSLTPGGSVSQSSKPQVDASSSPGDGDTDVIGNVTNGNVTDESYNSTSGNFV